MELFQVDITGFRKFKEKTELKTRGKVLAILGANEAGKSSLLKALVHLNSNGTFEPFEKSTGTDGSGVEIEATFSLSDEDRIAAGVPLARWYTIAKYADGVRRWGIEPQPDDRDYSHRPKLYKDITKIGTKAKSVSILAKRDEELLAETKEFYRTISDDKNDLSETAKEFLSGISERWKLAVNKDDVGYLRSFADRLASATQIESAESKCLIAGGVLWSRLPEFLLFGDEDRNLKSSYAWSEIAAPNVIPDALQNLAKIADLDLPRLIASMIIDVTDPDNDNMIERANDALKKNFNEVYNQSKVSVVLAKTDQHLSLHVHNNKNERTRFEQRSDGLRQFVALRCFTATRETGNIILLIDEAEQHLHYDAQADLVQMFGNQTVAAKVIYTTHSVGCLPEDLGNGVRLVEPVSNGSDWSHIENKFWKHKEGKEAAFSPILMGMGASTMAFFPTRSAVLVEGPADTILMPTMFREALGLTSLGLQFVHGLSEDGRMQLPLLNSTGRGVCYLLDDDSGGRTLKDDLLDRKMVMANIFQLQCSDGDCELEDFINPNLFAQAASEHVAQRLNVVGLLTSAGMPKVGKWDYLKKACENANVKAPSKVDIAYAVLGILDADPSRSILDKVHRISFKKVAKKVYMAAKKTVTE